MVASEPPSTTTFPPRGRKRIHTLVLSLIFATLSFSGLWFMRIEPALNDVPIRFQAVVETARLEDGTPLKTRYTGIPVVDSVLLWLVAAFSAGALGLDDGVRLQQIHFLVSFFSVVCIFNVEACRKRNARSAISFSASWGFFYQTVAGAAIIPMYCIAYMLTSARPGYLHAGREVPLHYARMLLPCTVLVYLVPTVAVYFPWNDAFLTQSLVALWQPAPCLVSLCLWVFSRPARVGSSSDRTAATSGRRPEKNTGATSDVEHLNRVYLVSFVVSTLTHIGIMLVCLTSSNPHHSLSYVFLPDKQAWKASTTLGLHWIFQWDWWGISVSLMLWCCVVVCDVRRDLDHTGRMGLGDPVRVFVVVSLMSVVLGPGSALAAVWWWRENKMVLLENRFEGRNKGKGD
ncbi:hypothetical protein K438DRAFT_1623671 [Mycena galopus ATCC 62051]|nr:hypothetical protein K438DRAFT_1623671 [Mycena galopus ATCC 62051]